jgi:hypothetical protein
MWDLSAWLKPLLAAPQQQTADAGPASAASPSATSAAFASGPQQPCSSSSSSPVARASRLQDALLAQSESHLFKSRWAAHETYAAWLWRHVGLQGATTLDDLDLMIELQDAEEQTNKASGPPPQQGQQGRQAWPMHKQMQQRLQLHLTNLISLLPAVDEGVVCVVGVCVCYPLIRLLVVPPSFMCV